MTVGILLLILLSQPPTAQGNLQGSATSTLEGVASNLLQRFKLPGMAALEQSGEIVVTSAGLAAARGGEVNHEQRTESRPTCTMLILRSRPAIDPELVKTAEAQVDTKMIWPSGCGGERASR